MTPTDIIAILGLSLALVSTTISAFTWIHSHNANRHQMADDQLHRLHEIELNAPHFRDDAWCQAALEEGAPTWPTYDVYATMVWNYLETLYDRFGEGKLLESSFGGSIIDLTSRHYGWFKRNEAYFGSEFRSFVNANVRK